MGLKTAWASGIGQDTVFKKMRRGGLTAVNCTCSILEGFRQTVKNIVWWRKAIDTHSDLIRNHFKTPVFAGLQLL